MKKLILYLLLLPGLAFAQIPDTSLTRPVGSNGQSIPGKTPSFFVGNWAGVVLPVMQIDGVYRTMVTQKLLNQKLATRPALGTPEYEQATGEFSRAYSMGNTQNAVDIASFYANVDPTNSNNTVTLSFVFNTSVGNEYEYKVFLTKNTATDVAYQTWRRLDPVAGIVQSPIAYQLEVRYNTGTGNYDFRLRQTTGIGVTVVAKIKTIAGAVISSVAPNFNTPYTDNSNAPYYDYAIKGFKGIIPKIGALNAFGDSQTEQVNTSNKWYTQSAHILPQFQWTNILATANGKSLTVNNYGIGGTKMSWFNALPFTKSIFNMTGNLAYNWSGVATVMGGWNNIDPSTDPTQTAFYDVLERAHVAMIYRLMIDDYAGISFLGFGHNGLSGGYPLDSWTSTGTDNGIATPAGETANNIMPFYYNDPNGARYRTALAAGQYSQFTVTDKRSVGIFYETDPSGGPFVITVNGNQVYSGTSQYTNISGVTNDVGFYPQVVVIKDLPASATVRITSTSGTTYMLAYGYINKGTSSLINKKTILYSTTTGNTHDRDNAILAQAARATYNAVAALSDLPVFFVNAYNNWYQETDSEPADLAHLTPSGTAHVAAAFEQPTKLSISQHPQVVSYKAGGAKLEASGSDGNVVGNTLAQYNSAGFLSTLSKNFQQSTGIDGLYGSKSGDNYIWNFNSTAVAQWLRVKQMDANGNTNWPKRSITAQGNSVELSDDNASWYWIHTDAAGTRQATPATVVTDGSGNRTITQTSGGAAL